MLLGNKLHLSSLDKPQKVMDIGTGTGIWAIEIGRRSSSSSSRCIFGGSGMETDRVTGSQRTSIRRLKYAGPISTVTRLPLD
jgi:hypothetical protein